MYTTTIFSSSSSIEPYQVFGNQVKEMVLSGLAEDGHLTKEKAEEISKEYVVVLFKKGWLGQKIDALFGNKPDTTYIKILKVPK